MKAGITRSQSQHKKPRNMTLHNEEIEALERLAKLSDADNVSQFVGRVARVLSDVNEPFNVSQVTLRRNHRHAKAA